MYRKLFGGLARFLGARFGTEVGRVGGYAGLRTYARVVDRLGNVIEDLVKL